MRNKNAFFSISSNFGSAHSRVLLHPPIIGRHVVASGSFSLNPSRPTPHACRIIGAIMYFRTDSLVIRDSLRYLGLSPPEVDGLVHHIAHVTPLALEVVAKVVGQEVVQTNALSHIHTRVRSHVRMEELTHPVTPVNRHSLVLHSSIRQNTRFTTWRTP